MHSLVLLIYHIIRFKLEYKESFRPEELPRRSYEECIPIEAICSSIRRIHNGGVS
jgi:hypothetical protein